MRSVSLDHRVLFYFWSSGGFWELFFLNWDYLCLIVVYEVFWLLRFYLFIPLMFISSMVRCLSLVLCCIVCVQVWCWFIVCCLECV